MTSEYQRLLISTLCAALAAWLLVAFTVPVQAEAPKQKTLWEGVDLLLGENAYEKGDYAKAAHQYRIAAEKNNAWSPVAQYYLGVLYNTGRGVPQDYAEAVRWFRKAAAQGNARAQNYLGLLYRKGEGVPQDYSEAVEWYRRAAEQGNAKAQNNLGNTYRKGEGVAQDYVLAHMWFNLAAAQGDRKARSNRYGVAKLMTPIEIAEAQRLALEFTPEKE